MKLEPDPAEAEVVRWVFDQYVNRDTSLRQIAKEIAGRGVAPARNGETGWSYRVVAYLLGNPIYAGDLAIGHARKTSDAFQRATPTVNRGAPPAIVDRRTFDLAATKLERNREGNRKTRGNSKSVFCGVVFCKRCGFRMVRKQREGGRAYFVCGHAVHSVQSACKQWPVYEQSLYRTLKTLGPSIDRELLGEVRAGATRDRLEEARRREVARLTAERDALRRKIEQGEERVLTAPASLVAGLTGKLLQWKDQLDDLERQLHAAENSVADDRERGELAGWWKENREGLVRLQGFEGENDDPLLMEIDRVRELLHRPGVRIEIEWKDQDGNGRKRLRPGKARVAARLGWPESRVKVFVKTGDQPPPVKHPMGKGNSTCGGRTRWPTGWPSRGRAKTQQPLLRGRRGKFVVGLWGCRTATPTTSALRWASVPRV